MKLSVAVKSVSRRIVRPAALCSEGAEGWRGSADEPCTRQETRPTTGETGKARTLAPKPVKSGVERRARRRRRGFGRGGRGGDGARRGRERPEVVQTRLALVLGPGEVVVGQHLVPVPRAHARECVAAQVFIKC